MDRRESARTPTRQRVAAPAAFPSDSAPFDPLRATRVFGKVLRRARARGPLRREHQPNGRAEGKTDWLAYLNELVEEAKASGAVQQFIERGGARGVTVAPLGNSN